MKTCAKCEAIQGREPMFLFDTDVITNVLKKRPSRPLLQRLALVPRNQQHISTVTVTEIVYGAMKSTRPAYHLENLEKILLPSVDVVGFDAKAAYVCGRIRAELERKGQPPGSCGPPNRSDGHCGEFHPYNREHKTFQQDRGVESGELVLMGESCLSP